MINMDLARKLFLSNSSIKNIQKYQQRVDDLVTLMDEGKDPVKLKEYFDEWTDLNFKLQKEWGFDQNRNYHKGFLLPHCSCPKDDNFEIYPLNTIIDQNCIYHGN